MPPAPMLLLAEQRSGKEEEEVSTNEDLMREHGILKRVMLACDEQEERTRLAGDLEAFNRMFAPHEAREDTVLFPELHKIVPPHEYDAMSEQFENIERKTSAATASIFIWTRWKLSKSN